MDLNEARKRARRALADVHPADVPWAGDERARHDVSGALPLPELVLFGLRDLLGLESWGPGEKLRWGVSGYVGSILFSITLEKFGPRLYLPPDAPGASYATVLRRLQRVAGLAEEYLRSVAEQQIEQGNVTIENQYLRFDSAYRFFRDKAREAYDSPPPKPAVLRGLDGLPTGWSGEPYKPQIEGGYLAGAMLDAYFSRLEHLLVLVLAFTDFDPSNKALLDFVGSSWDKKWKAVFDVAGDKAAKASYDRLKAVKETVRNPLAHGGFGKKGTSFYFHVPKLGALPALLTGHHRSLELFITRIPEEFYNQVCADLDGVDTFMRTSAVWAGVLYAESGLHVSFSEASRKAFRSASASPEELQAFIERESCYEDMRTNMDY